MVSYIYIEKQTMIDRLQESFGIPGVISFERDSNNFVKAILQSSSGHRVELSLYGAQVLSWLDHNSNELLFVSAKANFKRGKPIRGGIPLVFPQFGKGELPSHGFARTNMWEVREAGETSDDLASIKLALQDTPGTMDIWPHPFRLELTVSLGDKLKTHLKVYNCGITPFFFFSGFHTYFRVADIAYCQIQGLQGVTYQDALKGEKACFVEQAEALLIDRQIDRRFFNAADQVVILDQISKRKFIVRKSNIKDLIVWNPWEDGSREFFDLGPNEFSSFVCVEPIFVNQKVTLEPRAGYECWQEIEVARI